MVVVALDDGDEREVKLESVRMLPNDYPIVNTDQSGDQTPLGEVEGSTLTKLTVQVSSFDISL